MSLILDRKTSQKLVSSMVPGADRQRLLRALKTDDIEITLKVIGDHGNRVHQLVSGPRELLVLREELAERGALSGGKYLSLLSRNRSRAPSESLRD